MTYSNDVNSARFAHVRRQVVVLACLGVSSLTVSGFAATRGSEGIIAPQPKMGDPLSGLSSEEQARFILGQTRYNSVLTEEQGLGPVFNKNSCGNCHNNPLGGTGSQTVTRFGRDNKGQFDPMAEFGGSLLQVSGINDTCVEVVPPEATITQSRVTNGGLAYGLIESILDADLLANRDGQPLAQRGTAHMVGAFEDPPKAPLRVGRFGWKAQVATVLTFSADASLNEMGLTNQFIMLENDPNGESPPALGSPDYCDTVADPEDNFALGNGTDKKFIQVVTDFQRFLAPFPQTPKTGMSGEAIFNSIGCAVCHTPSFTTSNNENLESVLRNKTIRPYSDFLLHYMGITGDPIVQGDATEQMVKTPPLWGIRVRNPIWHDGRILEDNFETRIRQAIALHNPAGPASQGKPAALAFDALSPVDQGKLIAFLASLGQPEFDSDLDNQVNLADFQAFRACYTGPTPTYNPDSPCSIHDIDADGDVDEADFNSMMLVYRGHRRDCNGNGVLDLRDILLGAAPDADGNGIPDSCEPTCDSDVNGSGTVNVSDLLQVINQWGACPALTLPCGADINADHVVNVSDLLAVINAWGPCP